MFAVHGNCDPAFGVVGLRGPDDLDAVLVCRIHLADLRRLRPYEAERLARYLYVTFAPRPAPAAPSDEGLRLVRVSAGVGSQG